MNFINYDPVAKFYDFYAGATYDYDFFLSRIKAGTPVLELMSGTGRLSIPLIKAGAVLTCVDISQGMINILKRKLKDEELQANIFCADVQRLDFSGNFEIVLLPFQSFMELVGKEKQLNTLRSAYQALVPKGRFYCTMYNPNIRRKSVDGVMREVGTFTYGKGYIVVTGIETGGDPVVQRSQSIERFNNLGQLEERILQPMQFEMIEESKFRELATKTGFEVIAVFGDYEAQKFEAETSPVMIWELQKK